MLFYQLNCLAEKFEGVKNYIWILFGIKLYAHSTTYMVVQMKNMGGTCNTRTNETEARTQTNYIRSNKFGSFVSNLCRCKFKCRFHFIQTRVHSSHTKFLFDSRHRISSNEKFSLWTRQMQSTRTKRKKKRRIKRNINECDTSNPHKKKNKKKNREEEMSNTMGKNVFIMRNLSPALWLFPSF